MAFRHVPDAERWAWFKCDKCGERLQLHRAMLRLHAQGDRFEHNECTEPMHDRPRGFLQPEPTE